MKRALPVLAGLCAWLTFSVAAAQVPISQLPAASQPLSGTEPTIVVQGGHTDQAPVQAIANVATSPNTLNNLPVASVPLTGAEKVLLLQNGVTSTVPSSAFQSVPTGANVQNYGALCNGSNDDTSNFTAAFAVNVTVVVPNKNCYSASGVTVPPNHNLVGAFFSPGNPVGTASSILSCPSSVAHCLTLGDGSTNAPSMAANLTVLGIGGANASSDGIYVNAGYNVTLENVNVRNFGYGYHWQAYPSTGAGLGGSMINTYAGQIDTGYVWMDSWPELHVIGARYGSNGGGDYNGLAFFVISGGVGSTASGPNSLIIDSGIFDQGAVSGPQYAFYFRNLGSGGLPGIDAGSYKISNSHFENLTTAEIGSDSSWNIIQRVNMTNVEFNDPTKPCLALNAATNLDTWQIVGSQFFCSTFTINPSGSAIPINFMKFADDYFLGTFTVTSPAAGSTLNLTANTFIGAASFSGAFGMLASTGNLYSGGATFGETGLSQILDAAYPNKALQLSQANVWTNNQTAGTNSAFNLWATNGPAGVGRYSLFETAGSNRWLLGEDGTAESGANAGSNWNECRFSDVGAFIDCPISISRASGAVGLADDFSVSGASTFGGLIKSGTGYAIGSTVLCSATAPTITSAGTSPVVNESNGTCSFSINVGSGGTASAVVLGLPTALSGWSCTASDITTKSTSVFLQKQTGSTASSATITNYNTAGAATAFAANDNLRVSCLAD